MDPKLLELLPEWLRTAITALIVGGGLLAGYSRAAKSFKQRVIRTEPELVGEISDSWQAIVTDLRGQISDLRKSTDQEIGAIRESLKQCHQREEQSARERGEHLQSIANLQNQNHGQQVEITNLKEQNSSQAVEILTLKKVVAEGQSALESIKRRVDRLEPS